MDTQKKEIALIGAGKIGKGYTADLFSEAGYHLIFLCHSLKQAEAMLAGFDFPARRAIVLARAGWNTGVLGLAAVILGVAGLVPKFSALLTTIPYCVLGGATVSVFASIAMTGMKLVTSEQMDYRNTSIVGLAAALGMGISQASAALATFPSWVTTVFGKSPVVLATLVAVLLNVVLPKSKETK